jgi:ribosome biogenesis SPOUT family RNA methylase Rps3
VLDGNRISGLTLVRQLEGLFGMHPPRGRPELVGSKFAKAAHSRVVGGVLHPVDGAQSLPTVVSRGFEGKAEDGDQEEDLCKESFHVAGGRDKGYPCDPDKQEFLL